MNILLRTLFYLGLFDKTFQSNTTQTVINTNINEHKYVITQVILNTKFDSSIMTRVSDWSNTFESDIGVALDISGNQVDVIGAWDSEDDDVSDVIVDFVLYANTKGSNPSTYVDLLEEKVDAGLVLQKLDVDIYGMTVNDKTIYDKSKWQKAKDYANEKWDSFQSTEMSAPIVTAWVLGLGIPMCICVGYVLYKCKEKQSHMMDEGVVTVKLNTVKTMI